MARNRKLTHEQHLEVQQRNLNGESIRSLAAAFDVGPKTICLALERVGGGNRLKGKPHFSPDECDALMVRNIRGETAIALATEFGVDRATIGRAIRSAGGKPKYGVRRGERIIGNDGYAKVMVDDSDPIGMAMAQKRQRSLRSGSYVLEHRLVLARKIGRALLPLETVHHINGNKLDNRPENLELRVGRHGKGATGAHCATCTCFDHAT